MEEDARVERVLSQKVAGETPARSRLGLIGALNLDSTQASIIRRMKTAVVSVQAGSLGVSRETAQQEGYWCAGVEIEDPEYSCTAAG